MALTPLASGGAQDVAIPLMLTRPPPHDDWKADARRTRRAAMCPTRCPHQHLGSIAGKASGRCLSQRRNTNQSSRNSQFHNNVTHNALHRQENMKPQRAGRHAALSCPRLISSPASGHTTPAALKPSHVQPSRMTYHILTSKRWLPGQPEGSPGETRLEERIKSRHETEGPTGFLNNAKGPLHALRRLDQDG